MRLIAYCDHCRGMKVGWNRKYVVHALLCGDRKNKALKLLILTGILSSIVFRYPAGDALLKEIPASPATVVEASVIPAQPSQPIPTDRISSAINDLLAKNGIEPTLRKQVTPAIIASAGKYRIEPRLVASVLIVESRANQFAVSGANSVGVMQIHLPTWGALAVKQGINLFKIEDNVELGVRILSGYISTYGTWGGVARYNGFTDDPDSQRGAAEYVQKVQKIYGIAPQLDSPESPAMQSSLH
jgi:soluble lytic murein transglycosylase-like protein